MNRKTLNEKEIKEFQSKILSWYKVNKRDFPWRKTTDPYHILVSEIMLQQTQTSRVVAYFEKFIKRFPTINDLAKAKNSEVLKIWSGLGFNTRVIRLKEIAKTIVNDLNGNFPQHQDDLFKLKGIGSYTAAAIMAFAFNKKVAVIDTNIRRVLIHELHLNQNISPKRISEIGFSVIPNGKSRIWHNALMDYGALAATAKQTKITSKSKQSPFKGSEREVRGKILKLLLEQQTISKTETAQIIPHPKLGDIILKLKVDGLISERGGNIYIKK